MCFCFEWKCFLSHSPLILGGFVCHNKQYFGLHRNMHHRYKEHSVVIHNSSHLHPSHSHTQTHTHTLEWPDVCFSSSFSWDCGAVGRKCLSLQSVKGADQRKPLHKTSQLNSYLSFHCFRLSFSSSYAPSLFPFTSPSFSPSCSQKCVYLWLTWRKAQAGTTIGQTLVWHAVLLEREAVYGGWWLVSEGGR